MQKLIKREETLWIGSFKKLTDAHRKIVDYATTNPGDSHRPGEPQKITND